MPKSRVKDYQELAKKKSPQDMALYVMDMVHELQDQLETLNETFSQNPAAQAIRATRDEEARIEKIATRLAVKLAKLEKGDPGKDGQDGRTPTPQELVALIAPLIPPPVHGKDGKPGKTPTDAELLALIRPLIPAAVTAADVRRELEQNPLEITSINGLEERLKKIASRAGSGGTGATIKPKTIDVSSQCDGVTRTFNVPLNFGVLGVFSTQAPFFYRPIIDYTEGNRTVTLTSEVTAPQTGQSLLIQLLKM